MISSDKTMRNLMKATYVFLFIIAVGIAGMQADTKKVGAINGIVKDVTGAVIAGAEVTAKNLKTGAEYKTTTDVSGFYKIKKLPIGKYEVYAIAPGFVRFAAADIIIAESSARKLNITLKAGAMEEVVTVYAGKEEAFQTTTQQLSINGSVARSNTEHYADYGINPRTDAKKDSFSTFAIDVDTASFTIVRRKLNEGELPPPTAVRVEEFLNYFKYNYPQPTSAHPFSVTLEAAPSPFNKGRHLMRIGIQGRKTPAEQRPPAHLTFLVDTSGSMNQPDKIELVKRSLRILVEQLQPNDTVALTTYAGGVSTVLPATSAANKLAILEAIEQLESEGGTDMESGIELAYKQAHSTLQPGSINRIIICSDGDANIGKTSHKELLKMIEGYVKKGITVSAIGFGMGNYKDETMEQFANKGNGNYYYIDSLSQAKRVFIKQLAGTLQVIAKDVKIQVEFNPNAVKTYRLIGYENRDIRDEDFRDDKVDAGELGAGHSVTALYELELKNNAAGNLAIVRLRYKAPEGETAAEIEQPFTASQIYSGFDAAPDDFRFAIAVGAFAEVMRHSKEAEDWSLHAILEIARQASQKMSPERREFASLIDSAEKLIETALVKD